MRIIKYHDIKAEERRKQGKKAIYQPENGLGILSEVPHEKGF